MRYEVVRKEQLLAPPSAARSGEIVAVVNVRGNRRIEADAIRARIGTQPGAPYRAAQIAKDVREVYSLGFFRNVRVLTDAGPDGQIVIFEVEENPVVRQISISGNENVEGDQIRDVLTLTTGSTLDYPLLFENRARIQALYRAQGYYLAEVAHEIEPLSAASVGIHFVVEENPVVREISISGNESVEGDAVRDILTLTTGSTLDYPLLFENRERISALYRAEGYYLAEVEYDVEPLSEHSVGVHFLV